MASSALTPVTGALSRRAREATGSRSRAGLFRRRCRVTSVAGRIDMVPCNQRSFIGRRALDDRAGGRAALDAPGNRHAGKTFGQRVQIFFAPVRLKSSKVSRNSPRSVSIWRAISSRSITDSNSTGSLAPGPGRGVRQGNLSNRRSIQRYDNLAKHSRRPKRATGQPAARNTSTGSPEWRTTVR